MGGGLCGCNAIAQARAEFVEQTLTEQERREIAGVFNKDRMAGTTRERSELAALWNKIGEVQIWAAPPDDWLREKGAVPHDGAAHFLKKYDALEDAGDCCSLATFEYVVAERKIGVQKKARAAFERMQRHFEAPGFLQAVLHGIEAVLTSLRGNPTCTGQELRVAVFQHYGVDVPLQWLPCQIPGADAQKKGEMYYSAEFVSAKDLDQQRLLLLLPKEGEAVNYCIELQTALKRVFPPLNKYDSHAVTQNWLPWLHEREWENVELCMGIIEETKP